jgi:alkylation response protein AidB-like acyl-CoA dehydrogenase
MPSPVEPNVITYSCQGQQVVQVHGLHKKRQSTVFRAVHFGLEMQATGEINFNDVDIPENIRSMVHGNQGFKILLKLFVKGPKVTKPEGPE